MPLLRTGARVQTTVNNLDKAVLGTCARFEERQVGANTEPPLLAAWHPTPIMHVHAFFQGPAGRLCSCCWCLFNAILTPTPLLFSQSCKLAHSCAQQLLHHTLGCVPCVHSCVPIYTAWVLRSSSQRCVVLLHLMCLQVGGERYNLFTGCPQARTATIVLRGGSEQFIDEAERSLHDAIMIVRRALKHAHVVAGGGAIDMEVSWRQPGGMQACLVLLKPVGWLRRGGD